MNFLESIGFATIGGIISGILLGFSYLIYEEIKIKQSNREWEKNSYLLRHKSDPTNKIRVNKEFVQSFLDNGWEKVIKS